MSLAQFVCVPYCLWCPFGRPVHPPPPCPPHPPRSLVLFFGVCQSCRRVSREAKRGVLSGVAICRERTWTRVCVCTSCRHISPGISHKCRCVCARGRQLSCFVYACLCLSISGCVGLLFSTFAILFRPERLLSICAWQLMLRLISSVSRIDMFA